MSPPDPREPGDSSDGMVIKSDGSAPLATARLRDSSEAGARFASVFALPSSSSSPTNSVDVVLELVGEVVVNDIVDIMDI